MRIKTSINLQNEVSKIIEENIDTPEEYPSVVTEFAHMLHDAVGYVQHVEIFIKRNKNVSDISMKNNNDPNNIWWSSKVVRNFEGDTNETFATSNTFEETVFFTHDWHLNTPNIVSHVHKNKRAMVMSNLNSSIQKNVKDASDWIFFPLENYCQFPIHTVLCLPVLSILSNEVIGICLLINKFKTTHEGEMYNENKVKNKRQEKKLIKFDHTDVEMLTQFIATSRILFQQIQENISDF